VIGLVLALLFPFAQSDSVLVFEGATLFDGVAVVRDATVVIRGTRIEEVGPAGRVRVLPDARRVDARGKFILPGLIDCHFHFNEKLDPKVSPWLPLQFLANGVTTLREMGNWIEEENRNWLARVRARSLPAPRLLYSGPVIDGEHTVMPDQTIVVRDEVEARLAVRRLIEQGATSIKVYARLPLGLLGAVVEEAHARGVPVHAHLGTVDPRDAIEAGLDGIEHATTLVAALVPPRASEAFRQRAQREPNPRPIEAWASIDPAGPLAGALVDLMVRRRVNFDATLAMHEPREGETEERRRGHANMTAFTMRLYRAGGSLTMGSHGSTRSGIGFGLHREIEFHVEAGMAPKDALAAATSLAARVLRVPDRGTVAKGKLADLVVLDANPLEDIHNLRRVSAVVLDGAVLDREALLAARLEAP
jgi:imidazolonepropionase-like amidohydrolase